MKARLRAANLLRSAKENLSFLLVIAATFFALTLIVAMTFGSFYTSARKNDITIGNITVALEAKRIEEALEFGMNTLMVSSHTVDDMLASGAEIDRIGEYMALETRGIQSGILPDFTGIYGVVNDVYVDGTGTDWVPEGYDPYSRPWYIAAAEKNGKIAIVSPYIDAQTKKIMVSFSKILSDGKSAVSLDIALNNIYEVTENIQLNGNGYCFLVDGRGQVIAHRDKTQTGKNYLADAEFEGSDIRALIKEINASDGANTQRNATLDGDDCMVFTHSVQDVWNVVLVVNTDDLFEGIRASLIRNTLISLAIFILVGYFCTSNYRNKKKAVRFAEHIRTDDLTGLNNRGEFDRYLRAVISSAVNITSDRKLYLLLFDADGFKTINDRYGHQEGDRALRLIAGALMKACHGTDYFCARYGGDEFVIICKCRDESEVKAVIAEIDAGLQRTAGENRLPYSLSVSCGYSLYEPEKQSLSDLVDDADRRLYGSKRDKKAERT